jgi:hypothetical protein
MVPETPVKFDVGLEGVVTLPPAPEMIDQAPVFPVPGVLPANVAEVAHSVWFGPALEVLGFETKLMMTSSVEAVQGALLMVQRKV